MGAHALDPDEVATILVDADTLGDRDAAARYGISDRTIRLHRQRMRENDEIAALYRDKKARLEAQWAHDRRRVLGKALAKVEALIEQAGVDQLRDVVGAIKVIGDLELVGNAIRGEQLGGDSPGQTAPAAGRLEYAASRLAH
jgi:hypothetical protein